MTLDEILLPEDVNLALRATDKRGAIEEVLVKLNGDPRVKDWQALADAVIERDAPAIAGPGCGICIAHGRIKAVTQLVMAAGRSEKGFACPGVDVPVKLVFVAAIPAAFDSEYLRVVGAIARVCRDPAGCEELLGAEDADAFVELLSAATEKL
jgi:PTS system fructose-specific IIC component